MGAPMLTCRSDTFIAKKKTGNQNRNSRDKIFRNVTGYTRKVQIRNIKIGEGLSIFNLNNKIIISGSQWNYECNIYEL
jgi:hypothetical protein